MSIRLTQVELQSEEDTVIFLASGHLNCVEQVKPLLEAENFLEDHDGEDIEVSLSHYLYGDEGPAYDADQNHIRLIQALEDTGLDRRAWEFSLAARPACGRADVYHPGPAERAAITQRGM